VTLAEEEIESLAVHARGSWPICMASLGTVCSQERHDFITAGLAISSTYVDRCVVTVRASSGKTLDCRVLGPRIEAHRDLVFITTTTGHGLCTLNAVPRSTQPSTFCEMLYPI